MKLSSLIFSTWAMFALASPRSQSTTSSTLDVRQDAFDPLGFTPLDPNFNSDPSKPLGACRAKKAVRHPDFTEKSLGILQAH